jgi:glutamate synthase domain-containing protein 1
MRKQGLSLEMAVATVASPLWKEIDRMDEDKKELIKSLRIVYSSLLVNGPFSIILGSRNGMVALNDRIKLRNMVAATKGDFLYVASEESAIREICAQPEEIWVPKGGEPVIGLLEGVDTI